MIEAVVFDLNGVFIQSPRLSDRFEEKFHVSGDKFYDVLQEIMPKVRKPRAEDSFNYWKPHLKDWGLNLNKEQFFDFWFSGEKEVPEMINLARKVKENGTKIFILSNNFTERAKYYDENFPFLKDFDKVYYSWQTGFVKPDLEAYKNLLRENNLQPEQCLYFDDSAKNIKAASSLGIISYLFKDTQDLQAILKAAALLG